MYLSTVDDSKISNRFWVIIQSARWLIIQSASTQKESNRKKSIVRARVEHVLGAQSAMGGQVVRTIGLLRAKVKIGMMNLVYNMVRFIQLYGTPHCQDQNT